MKGEWSEMNYENMDQIQNDFSTTTKEVINYQNRAYKKIRTNENVKRGKFDDLICVTFRNEDEHHNLNVYYQNGQIEFVETGYSLN
jgi:hypothetical protein